MRKLAGSFIKGLQSKLGIKIGSDHALWNWAARHASWVLNRFQPVKGAAPRELVYGKSYKGLSAEDGYIRSLNKGEARRRLWLVSEKVESQDTYVLTDDVQVALSKCVRRTDQDWSKRLAIYKSFNAFSWERRTNFGGRIIATKRRASRSIAISADIPQERVMLKFRDEDAEAVMAKALEGGSDSEKEQPLFLGPIPVPARWRFPAKARKRDGGEVWKPCGEEPPSKKQKVLSADEKTLEGGESGQPNPVTPTLSSRGVTIRAFETKGST